MPSFLHLHGRRPIRLPQPTTLYSSSSLHARHAGVAQLHLALGSGGWLATCWCEMWACHGTMPCNAPACTARATDAERNEIAVPHIVLSMQRRGASAVCTGDSQRCSFLSRTNQLHDFLLLSDKRQHALVILVRLQTVGSTDHRRWRTS